MLDNYKKIFESNHIVLVFFTISVSLFFLFTYLLSTVYVPLWGKIPDQSSVSANFMVYYNAASAVVNHHGDKLYDYKFLDRQFFTAHPKKDFIPGNQLGPFDYPPFMLIFFLPLIYFPLAIYWVSIIWMIINQFFLAAGLFFLLRSTSHLNRIGSILLIFLSIIMAPVVLTIQYGNVNVLLFFLLSLSIYLLSKHKDWQAGSLVGIAAAIKFTPALLAIFFLLKRKFKAALTSFLAFLASVLIGILISGWQSSWTFFRFVLPSLGWFTKVSDYIGVSKYWPVNQSIHGFLLHLLTNSPNGQYSDGNFHGIINSWPAVLLMTIFGCGLVLFYAVKYVLKSANNQTSVNLGFALFVTAAMLVSSITWVDHLVLMIIPLVIVADALVALNDVSFSFICLVSSAYALIAINFPYSISHLTSGFKWLLATPAFYGLLIFFIVILLMISKGAAMQKSEKMPSVPPAD